MKAMDWTLEPHASTHNVWFTLTSDSDFAWCDAQQIHAKVFQSRRNWYNYDWCWHWHWISSHKHKQIKCALLQIQLKSFSFLLFLMPGITNCNINTYNSIEWAQISCNFAEQSIYRLINMHSDGTRSIVLFLPLFQYEIWRKKNFEASVLLLLKCVLSLEFKLYMRID